jgi:hypothetical protein
MIEFRHRTDLFNSQAVCFLFSLTDDEFREMRANGFPKPEYFRMMASPYPHQSPRKVVYWRRPVVEEYMATARRKKKMP